MATEVFTAECRACLRQIDGEVCQNLFQEWCTSWAVPGALLADFLAKLADVEILIHDKHSKVMCSECYTRLSDAYSFMKIVQRSDTILRKRCDSTSSTDSENEKELSSCHEPKSINHCSNGSIDIMNTSVEVKQEAFSDDEYGSNLMDNDWEPTMDIKIEPEEIVAPVQPNIKINGAFSVNETNEMNHDSNHLFQEKHLDNTIKQEPIEVAKKREEPLDLPHECMLCTKILHSIKALKKHVISKHSYRTVKRKTDTCTAPSSDKGFTCATCRQTFKTRTDLMVHETCHNAHVCYICSDKFSTFQQLSQHRKHCSPNNRTRSNHRSKKETPPQSLKSNSSSTTNEKESMTSASTTELALAEVKDEPMEDTNSGETQESSEDQLQLKHYQLDCSGLYQEDCSSSDSLIVVNSEKGSFNSLIECSDTRDSSKTYKNVIRTRSQKDANLATAQEETILGTAQEETFLATTQEETILGTTQEETILGTTQEKTILGTAQEETFLGTTQEETILGTTQEETILGTTQEETILGTTQEETILGTTQEETILGTTQERVVETALEEMNLSTAHMQNFVAENDGENDSFILPDLDNSLSSDAFDSIQGKNSIPDTDTLNQNMKVHLAINPLNKGSAVIENKMDIDRSDKSNCKLRLVNISELTEKSVIQ